MVYCNITLNTRKGEEKPKQLPVENIDIVTPVIPRENLLPYKDYPNLIALPIGSVHNVDGWGFLKHYGIERLVISLDGKIYISDSSTPIYHQHFSTTDIRRMFLEQYTREKKDMVQQTYMCPICSELEPVLFPSSETRRLVLADSTMYGIWGKKMPSNTPHFDIDAIVGGRVRDMTRALVKNYLHLPNRFEIVVIAGINNLGAGEKAEEVIKEVEELKRVVRDHSLKWKHNPPSYAAVSTVLLAPKFCSLYVPPSPPEPEIAMWVPAPGFRNKYSEIKKLNDLIIAANTRDNLKCVRLDFQGVKRFKSGTVQHIFDTKPGATQVWRETEVFRKLHFTMEIKLKLVKYITTCFEANRERVANQSHN